MSPISRPQDLAARPVTARVWSGPHIDVAGDSRRGRGSVTNEDAFIAVDYRRQAVLGDSSIALEPGTTRENDTQCRLLAVADGRGGRGGQVASWAAVDQLARYLAVRMPWPIGGSEGVPQEIGYHVEQAYAVCRERVRETASTEQSASSASLTSAVILWPTAVVAHVGTCRAYLYRDNRLRRLTPDLPSTNPGSGEPERGPALALVGGDAAAPAAPGFAVHLGYLELEPGDSLLLCTDGLWMDGSEYQLARALHQGTSASDALRRALDRRPDDDATALVARVSTRGRVTH